MFCVQDLADRYASVTGFAVDVVRSALEIIQSDAVMKGEGNKEYRETSVATLELHLPKETRVSEVSGPYSLCYIILSKLFQNIIYYLMSSVPI